MSHIVKQECRIPRLKDCNGLMLLVRTLCFYINSNNIII